MLHKICPICGAKLFEIKPREDERTVNHKVYVCETDVDHKFWVSEYESDCLRWNPAVNFEDSIYFRKFKNTNREVQKELSLKELKEYLKSPEHLDGLADREDDTELFRTQIIERKYNETPEYEEIFDKKVHENLLGIIQSLNETIKQLVTDYHKLSAYTEEVEAKVKKDEPKSGLILKI